MLSSNHQHLFSFFCLVIKRGGEGKGRREIKHLQGCERSNPIRLDVRKDRGKEGGRRRISETDGERRKSRDEFLERLGGARSPFLGLFRVHGAFVEGPEPRSEVLESRDHVPSFLISVSLVRSRREEEGANLSLSDWRRGWRRDKKLRRWCSLYRAFSMILHSPYSVNLPESTGGTQSAFRQ